MLRVPAACTAAADLGAAVEHAAVEGGAAVLLLCVCLLN
jgi:hypothetical protein